MTLILFIGAHPPCGAECNFDRVKYQEFNLIPSVNAMDRNPVKDPLPLDEDEDDKNEEEDGDLDDGAHDLDASMNKIFEVDHKAEIGNED